MKLNLKASKMAKLRQIKTLKTIRAKKVTAAMVKRKGKNA